jgi:uncharacterized protein YprB with RNaseH-like and TPR domain
VTKQSIFRIGCLDLEMSNLNADFGFILCAAVKEVGVEEPHVLRIDQFPNYKRQPWNDADISAAIRDLVVGFDLIVTWNGARFDVPFLNTRLSKHGLAPLPRKLHKDLLYTSRYQLRLHSNRLASVQEFFELEMEKTSISGEYWNRAVTGNKEALDYIVDHCIRDVFVLEEVLGKLKPFIREIKA